MRNPLDARSRVLTGNIRHIIRHELDPRSCYKLIHDTCFSTSLPGFFFLDCLSKRNFQLTAEIQQHRRERGTRRTKFIGLCKFHDRVLATASCNRSFDRVSLKIGQYKRELTIWYAFDERDRDAQQ